MPAELPIDRAGRLRGLIAAYHEQVLVCTGQDDWPSRIEDAAGGDNLAADLKGYFGRGGKYRDPFHNVSVLNASFPGASAAAPAVYLLPSFRYLPAVARDAAGLDSLARACVDPAAAALLPASRPVSDVLVLVCGHGGRDARCGILGPVLRAAFARELARAGWGVEGDKTGPGEKTGELEKTTVGTARVGLISHIGGHKFAGNVIVYLPPGLRTFPGGEPHPLAGCGVWYGRVEPRHVEGLVRETVGQGRIVLDHFRGGISREREMFR